MHESTPLSSTRKPCSRCKTFQPRSAFYRGKRTDGLTSWCKACYQWHNDRQRTYRKAYYDARRAEKRAKDRAYYLRNRHRLIMRQRAYTAANLEAKLARDLDYRQRNRARRLAYQRAYDRAYPEVKRIAQAKRRAKKRQVPHEPISLLDIARRDNWRCHICGKKVTRRTWSLDHLIPLFFDGPHLRWNVALAHQRCNSKRGIGRRIPGQLHLFG